MAAPLHPCPRLIAIVLIAGVLGAMLGRTSVAAPPAVAPPAMSAPPAAPASTVPPPPSKDDSAASGGFGAESSQPVAPPAPRPLPEALRETRPILGFTLNVHHIGDLQLYLRSVDAIADLSANTLVVMTPWFMDKVDSDTLEHLPDRCPTDEQLIAILTRARLRGLRTMLIPIVLIAHPEQNEWRGVIKPTDREAWWTSYDAFIDHFAHIAELGDADVLAVGSELNSTEKDIDQWTRIVTRARASFDGALTYSANWDRFHIVPFWELVDIISVSSYFELAEEDESPGPGALAEAWADPRDRMLREARRIGRPLFISEIGYPSLPGAAAHPWNYVNVDDVDADHQAQARCWDAFFRAWEPVLAAGDGPLIGLSCYHWDPYHAGGRDDTGYGFTGKPSLQVIEAAFKRLGGHD